MTDKEKFAERVDEFAALMKEKFNEKADMGWRGWDKSECFYNVLSRLERAVHREMESIADNGPPQEIDIANLALMIYYGRRYK